MIEARRHAVNTLRRSTAIFVLAFCAMATPSAQAFTDARVTPPDGAFSLDCRPLSGPEIGDRDPTVRILISMDLDASNDWTARTFTVEHALWSRHIINRDDQYTGRISKDHGVANGIGRASSDATLLWRCMARCT
jgi:hypothetical protein